MGDLRVEKTMGRLKEAFLDLLEHHRFEEITVQQLCVKAQIRRATFYTHFADKYEFLSFFIGEMREEFVKEMEQQGPMDEGCYDGLFKKLIQFFKEHPQLVRNVKDSQMQYVMMDIFAGEVKVPVYDYLQKKFPQDNSLNEMKACFYAGGIIQLARLWMDKPDEVRADEINWLGYLTED